MDAPVPFWFQNDDGKCSALLPTRKKNANKITLTLTLGSTLFHTNTDARRNCCFYTHTHSSLAVRFVDVSFFRLFFYCSRHDFNAANTFQRLLDNTLAMRECVCVCMNVWKRHEMKERREKKPSGKFLFEMKRENNPSKCRILQRSMHSKSQNIKFNKVWVWFIFFSVLISRHTHVFQFLIFVKDHTEVERLFSRNDCWKFVFFFFFFTLTCIDKEKGRE